MRIYGGTNEIMKLLIAQKSCNGLLGTRRRNMADAFIYDDVRTPRGRGKKDGSLHEVPALDLAAQALAAHQGAQRARYRPWSMTSFSAASIRSAKPAA